MPIREDEWLREVERLTRRSTDGFSTEDMATALHLSPRIVREKIKAAIRVGVLMFAGYRDGTSMDGKRFRMPVYRRAAKTKARPKR